MTTESDERRRIPASVWWMLVAWVAVTVAAVIWALPHEEDHLTERAEGALSGEPLLIDFSGRDALLSGEALDAAQLDRAIATVRQLHGVRRVDTSEVTVNAVPVTTALEQTPPDITVAFADGTVTLTGTVPNDRTKNAIVGAAEARWGADNVVDRVVVGANTSGAAWLAGIVPAIDGVDDLAHGSIAVGQAGVLVTGAVASNDVRAGIEGALAQAFGPNIAIENRLDVAALADPSFSAELLEDGSVLLRGVMPDQESIDTIVASCSSVYGSANVVNQMSIGTGIGSPDYLAALAATFGTIDGLNPWQVVVEDGRAVISGLAVSDAALNGTLTALTTAYGFYGLDLASELEVDPSAIATVLTELLRGSATFEVGSAELSTEAMSLLDEAIEILQANATTLLTVEGHTDDVGDEADNLALSEARAQAVVAYLVGGGVDAARLTAVGYGESRPIADNDTADGRAQNRRIQFVVEGGDS